MLMDGLSGRLGAPQTPSHQLAWMDFAHPAYAPAAIAAHQRLPDLTTAAWGSTDPRLRDASDRDLRLVRSLKIPAL
jgi:hypothetical protein